MRRVRGAPTPHDGVLSIMAVASGSRGPRARTHELLLDADPGFDLDQTPGCDPAEAIGRQAAGSMSRCDESAEGGVFPQAVPAPVETQLMRCDIPRLHQRL
jgi:hypothetical protein